MFVVKQRLAISEDRCNFYERKHKTVKQFADTVQNTRIFEVSVTSRTLLENMRQLRKTTFQDCLIGEARSCPALALCVRAQCAEVASSVCFGGVTYAIGDAVFVDGECATVTCCACLEKDRFVLIIEGWSRVKKLSASSSTWRPTRTNRCVIFGSSQVWHHYF